MNIREAILITLCAVFASYVAICTIALVKISDQNKAQQRVLLCFDKDNNVTYGNDFKECRIVAIRELS
jgi:hypothetical protein